MTQVRGREKVMEVEKNKIRGFYQKKNTNICEPKSWGGGGEKEKTGGGKS